MLEILSGNMLYDWKYFLALYMNMKSLFFIVPFFWIFFPIGTCRHALMQLLKWRYQKICSSFILILIGKNALQLFNFLPRKASEVCWVATPYDFEMV